MSNFETHTELTVMADYDYQPEEPEVNYPAEITLNGVYLDGLDIQHLLDDDEIDSIKDRIIDHIQEGGSE